MHNKLLHNFYISKMKYILLPLLLLSIAAKAQLPATGMIKAAYTRSVYAVDSIIRQLGFEKVKTSVEGIFPVIYDKVKWNPDSLKFPNRYEVSKWRATSDSTLAITFVTSDTVQFKNLINQFVAEKFVRTAYGENTINKDYKSVNYPGIIMRVSYNKLLDMGPDKIAVYYSWN